MNHERHEIHHVAEMRRELTRVWPLAPSLTLFLVLIRVISFIAATFR
jgi:hypothetical protein